MDLNYLYKRHQISLFKSENATCPQARDAHRGLAVSYATEIERTRNASGFRLSPEA